MRDERYSPMYMDSTWTAAGMSARVFDTRVMPLFGVGLLVAGTAAYLGRALPFGLLILAMIGELALVFTAQRWQRIESRGLNLGLFFLFTALSGLTLVPLLQWANMRGGIELIALALGVSGLTFGGLMVYSLSTRRDFTGIGGFLVAGMIGVIVASLVTFFVGGTVLHLGISCVSVLLFSGFVLYEMSMIKKSYRDEDYIYAAIGLFLAFIGIFQSILRILGLMGGDD